MNKTKPLFIFSSIIPNTWFKYYAFFFFFFASVQRINLTLHLSQSYLHSHHRWSDSLSKGTRGGKENITHGGQLILLPCWLFWVVSFNCSSDRGNRFLSPHCTASCHPLWAGNRRCHMCEWEEWNEHCWLSVDLHGLSQSSAISHGHIYYTHNQIQTQIPQLKGGGGVVCLC